jgi:hypothetical protein
VLGDIAPMGMTYGLTDDELVIRKIDFRAQKMIARWQFYPGTGSCLCACERPSIRGESDIGIVPFAVP